MIKSTLKKVSQQLENLTQQQIGIQRALDLLEASTESLEEIVAINLLRECVGDHISQVKTADTDFHIHPSADAHPAEQMTLH